MDHYHEYDDDAVCGQPREGRGLWFGDDVTIMTASRLTCKEREKSDVN